jgi:hypothetical protein
VRYYHKRLTVPVRILTDEILAARVASAAADREAVERVRALADEVNPWKRPEMTQVEFYRRLRAALSVPTEAEGTS